MMEPASKPEVAPLFPPGGMSKWRGIQVSRRSHRIASVALGIGFLIAVAVLLAPDGADAGIGVDQALASLLPFGSAVFLMVTRFSIGLDDLDALLDERERLLRDRARSIAYQIVTVLIFAAWLAHVMADIVGGIEWALAGDDLRFLLLTCAIAGFALPAAVLAWIAPDPVPEEETA